MAESITLLSAASARAALPGTVTFAAVNGWDRRLALVVVPTRRSAGGPVRDAANSVPARRWRNPEDVAGAILYLIGAGLVTGTILRVNGGFTVA